MKKFFSRFLKQDRGVVMMEYVVLGVFTVAVTVVAAMTLGIAYSHELGVMTQATVGNTSGAVAFNDNACSWAEINTKTAETYVNELIIQKHTYTGANGAQIYKAK